MYTPRTWGCTRPTTPFAPLHPVPPSPPMGAADGSAPGARRAAQQAHVPPPRDRHRQILGTSGSRCRRFAASLRLALVIDLGDQLRQPRRRLSLVGSQHHLPPCTARAGRLAARDRNPLPRPPGIDPFFSTYAAPSGPLLGRADPPGPGSIGRFTYYPRPRGRLPWGACAGEIRRGCSSPVPPGAVHACHWSAGVRQALDPEPLTRICGV